MMLTKCHSPDGGVNLTEPVGSWRYTDLQRIMALNITQPNTTTATSSQPTSSSSTTSTASTSAVPTSQSSATPTGTIAGGVVGGVVVLALIIGMAIYFRRRRSRHARKPPNAEEPAWIRKELPANDAHIYETGSQQKFEMDASHRRAELAASPAVHELSALNGDRPIAESK